LCGRFVPTGNLISFNLLELCKDFSNCSAKENRTSFDAPPITREKCTESVKLDDKTGGKTREIQ